MPNGGSDCCGTCWFNARNKGKAGRVYPREPGPGYCTIRDLTIDMPFYTFCGNHPHHRPDRDAIPVGPVFTGIERNVLALSPDTEEIRRHLLDLLGQIKLFPDTEYPIGLYADELVVWQLGEFRERRAVEALRLITLFNTTTEVDMLGRTHRHLVQLAFASLAKIESDAT